MRRDTDPRTRRLWLGVLLLAVPLAVPAQTPGEVQSVAFAARDEIVWSPLAAADVYNVYRGGTASSAARCHGFAIDTSSFETAAEPEPGAAFFYVVTGETAAGEEGTPGAATGGAARDLAGRCTPVMRAHVLNRAGYGWDEWTADRIATLGIDGFIDEQLDPSLIDEATNTPLNSRLAAIDPPATIFDLIAQQVVRGVYARRQLEQQVAVFWDNHFNTFWGKVADVFGGVFPQCQGPTPPPQCDPAAPTVAYREASLLEKREQDTFRDLAFSGNFREILEASATSLAMIIYLDTYANLAGSPNENYARELLELYSMGVDGGYTQQDIEELARVLTGWTGCKKKIGLHEDPLAACISNYWEDEPPGYWVGTFNTPQHDCGSKVLFQGTPQEAFIPDTCADPVQGVNDLYLALDAIVAHPSTPRFISRKLLERFVTDEPDQQMIDALVTVWNDASNPHGVGDLRELLRAALKLGALTDPDRVGGKIKTPLEHFVSALRATRASTDGLTQVVDYLVRAQHIPHYNEVPTGWPEDGGSWLDTANTLERQNFGLHLAAVNQVAFGSDVIALLLDNGVSIAPGNAEAIVDFYAGVLFGGGLTPAERQAAIDYLDTDANGVPSPYDNARIRETVGFLLGYPQFQEQ